MNNTTENLTIGSIVHWMNDQDIIATGKVVEIRNEPSMIESIMTEPCAIVLVADNGYESNWAFPINEILIASS